MKKLVLVGGGHTHVLLIRALGMQPIDDVSITLISEKVLTPYSGMLPGYVAGHYSLEQTNINLQQLCEKAGVVWLEAKVTKLDVVEQLISVNQQLIPFDKLSIDIGSTPDLSIQGAQEFALGVKPITGFQQRWGKLLDSTKGNKNYKGDWGIVGAGAGGVELVLAMAYRLRHCKELNFYLIYRGQRILTNYPPAVIAQAEKSLQKYGVKLCPNFAVAEVTENGVVADSGESISLTQSIWCTGAKGASWLQSTNITTTEDHFIEVNQFLQSVSHPNIFAAGDIAEMIDDPRPKAGVYAVRQAPMLEQNLRLAFREQEMHPVELQTQFLSLLSLGDRVGIASRNGFAVKGRWVWRWKNYIDGKFIALFKH